MRRGTVEQEYDAETSDNRRDWTRHPLVIGLIALSLFALGFLAFLFSADRIGGDTTAAVDNVEQTTDDAGADDAEESEPSGPEADASDEAEAMEAATDSDEDAADDATTTTDPDAATDADTDTELTTIDGAFVEATLNLDAGPGPGLFSLRGRVPDQETADAVLAAAELSYAPFVESDIEVDDSLDPAEWLALSPQLIGLLPSITDGTIRMVDGAVELEARSPNPEYLALLEGALQQLGGGLPVEVVDTEITDLRPPRFEAEMNDGKLALSGFVPSEGIRDILIGGAIAAYGEENVVADITIAEDTYTSFWMYTMPGIYQLFAPFPKYNLLVADGATSGTLQGGVSFDVDSTEITPEAAQVLNIAVAVLSRDLSIYMGVEGHTDSSGPDGYNEALSLARAQSVTAYLSAAGIDEARLTSSGAGESAPIAPNTTEEGMALNRRVEFEFGPQPTE